MKPHPYTPVRVRVRLLYKRFLVGVKKIGAGRDDKQTYISSDDTGSTVIGHVYQPSASLWTIQVLFLYRWEKGGARLTVHIFGAIIYIYHLSGFLSGFYVRGGK